MSKDYKGKIDTYSIVKNKSNFEKVKIKRSKDAYDVITKFYSTDIEVYESFFILLLNRSNHALGYAKISQGGVVGTIVDVKLIAKYCVDSLCSGVVLAHNHPSGNLGVSDPDVRVTKKIKDALLLLDVTVLDSLILTTEGYTSMADEGLF